MKDKRKLTLVAVLAILGITLITAGVTYALFSYNGTGETYSTISVGSLTFRYKEEQGKGQGISIKNAMPVADNDVAKNSNDYFEFTIESTTTEEVKIPYTVTAKMSDNSYENFKDYVDLYLTEVDSGGEEPTAVFGAGQVAFSDLGDYSTNNSNEKIIHSGFIPSDYTGSPMRFRLRMWIDQNADLSGQMQAKYFCGDTDVTDEYYSGYTCSDGRSPSKSNVQGSDYNNKEFSVTVNVYATGAVGTRITSVSIGGYQSSNAPAGANYDQQVTIPYTDNSLDFVSQIDGDVSDTYIRITRMNEDFTDEYALNASIENENVKRIASTEYTDDFSYYMFGETWGNFYAKLELFNSDTDELLDTIKLKVVVQKPVVNFSNFRIRNSDRIEMHYCDGVLVSAEDYANCHDEDVWIEGNSDDDWGHYETVHHTPSMQYIPEERSKYKKLLPVTGKDWDYELEIPYDAYKFVLEYDQTGDDCFSIDSYTTDSTFTEVGYYISTSYSFDTVKQGDAYIIIKANAYNGSGDETIKEVKIKLIRTSKTSYLSPSWY